MKNYMEEILKEHELAINEKFTIYHTKDDTFEEVCIDGDYDLWSDEYGFDETYWNEALLKGNCTIDKIKPKSPIHNEYKLFIDDKLISKFIGEYDDDGVTNLLQLADCLVVKERNKVKIEIDRLGKVKSFDVDYDIKHVFQVEKNIPVKIK